MIFLKLVHNQMIPKNCKKNIKIHFVAHHCDLKKFDSNKMLTPHTFAYMCFSVRCERIVRCKGSKLANIS